MILKTYDFVMRFIDEFRDKSLMFKLSDMIRKTVLPGLNYTFMEVCGGHTAAIHRFGIASFLPAGVRLISGPGCPVCVTAIDFIDRAVAYSSNEDTIIATFGDLIRVPGTYSSLGREKASGADIRIVLSALDALDTARHNPGKRVIFPGIGFETTAPGTAVTIIQAEKEKIGNFYLLSAHKVMPPAIEAIIHEGTEISGFICPGHVAAVTGSEIFDFIPDRYGIGCVITGFEPVDILLSVLLLIRQVNKKSPAVEIQYARAVIKNGNPLAIKYISDVFMPCDTRWRGLGTIRGSGLELRPEYRRFDAVQSIPVELMPSADNEMCICGDILRGVKIPPECPLFGSVCSPENPSGACMVSDEGACNTHYKYNSGD